MIAVDGQGDEPLLHEEQRWPEIDEPELRARLALGHDAFVELISGFLAAVGRREFSDDAYALALGYPWPRPPKSFVLDGDEMRPLESAPDVAPGERWPLLAFGSNGSPETLIRKLSHLPEAERRIPVLAGELHDFDVGAAAFPSAYGAFPATIFPSPGTVLRASLLWVTPAQLTALAWTEVSYLLGRLDGVRFEPELPDAQPVEAMLAFVSRWGARTVDGEVATLAALPARGRTAPGHTQEQLLDQLASEGIGESATARDLVAWIYEDFAAAAAALRLILEPAARPFSFERWTRYPA